jgi:hypothetical protein
MMRKSIVALAAIAVLGTMTIPMTSAVAQFNNRPAFNDNRATFNNRRAFHNNRAAFNNRFVVRNHFARNRFGWRRPFIRDRFAFASCSIVRRTWTPWGWRWHRVWVC